MASQAAAHEDPTDESKIFRPSFKIGSDEQRGMPGGPADDEPRRPSAIARLRLEQQQPSPGSPQPRSVHPSAVSHQPTSPQHSPFGSIPADSPPNGSPLGRRLTPDERPLPRHSAPPPTATDRAAADAPATRGPVLHEAAASPLARARRRSFDDGAVTPGSEMWVGAELFDYRQLVWNDAGRKLPPGANVTKLEMHLSEQQFVEVIGMTRPEFYGVSVGEQMRIKQNCGLF
tara:strand:- start:113 stop:805 length:693 start_codon:yes stop_codon:yes gene_type:complete